MTANQLKHGSKSCSRSSSSDSRRANKPLMEKRRRARINQSLNVLKTLIVDTNREKRPSKLEKADILELTVSYLQKNQHKSSDNDEQKFSEGYQECTKAAVKFLESCSLDQNTLEKLMEFLKLRRDTRNNLETSKHNKIDSPKVQSGSKDSTWLQVQHPRLSDTTKHEVNCLKVVDTGNSNIYEAPPQSEIPKSKFMKNNCSETHIRKHSSSLKNNLDTQNEIFPVNLSKEAFSVAGKSFHHPIASEHISPSNTSDAQEVLPLDLSKYSTRLYDEEGMWRPW